MKTLTLPGSKSITNRDLILSALTPEKIVLKGFLTSDDTVYMIQALRTLGIEILEQGDRLTIYGGRNKISGHDATLYLGNSGTSTRFLTALSALNQKGTIVITGDDRMKKRPIADLAGGIEQLGVHVETTGGSFPITIHPGSIQSSKVRMNGESSSQYFTALLQIAPLLPNGLLIEVVGDLVSKPYIDITLSEMAKFGVSVENHDYQSFQVLPGEYHYPYEELTIEGDASALSYIACFLALHGGVIHVENIGTDSKQGDYQFLECLKIFGLKYESDGGSTTLHAPGLKQGSLEASRDFEIDFEDMPDVSMSFIIMSIFLPGKTHITGLKTLNLKECLRIDAMRDELSKLGVEVESDGNSITIGELAEYDASQVREIETYDDHRIAMCFGVLGSYLGGLEILNPNCVSKTYPNFWKDLEDWKQI